MLDSALVLGGQLVIMAIYMAVGFIIFRTRLMNDESTKMMTNIVLYVVTPLLTLSCFNFEYDPQTLARFFLAIGIGIVVLFVGILLSYFAFFKCDKEVVASERFGIVFGNSGFLGIPLMIHMFGPIGGIYGSAFAISFNILNWTFGVTLLGKAKKEKGLIGTLKLLNHPFFYCLGIGLIMYIARIHFPGVIQTAVDTLGGMTSPLAMMVSGMYLAQANVFKAFTDPRIYYICFFRLIAVPMAVLGILKLIGIDHTLAISMMIAAAAPMAATTVFFSNDIPKRLKRSRGLFLVSTLLSIITMPVIIGIANLIL